MCFQFDAMECILHRRIVNPTLNINEETIFEGLSGNRSGFDPGHIDLIIDKMGQHMVQRTTFVRQNKAQAGPLRSPVIYFTI